MAKIDVVNNKMAMFLLCEAIGKDRNAIEIKADENSYVLRAVFFWLVIIKAPPPEGGKRKIYIKRKEAIQRCIKTVVGCQRHTVPNHRPKDKHYEKIQKFSFFHNANGYGISYAICLVFEFISPACVEEADIFKVSFHALEGFFYKPCCIMFSCGVTGLIILSSLL